MPVVDPTLEYERALLTSGAASVLGCDEVGRGAIAGPVAVGVTVLRPGALDEPIPEGLRDSKAITERRRPRVAELAAAWVQAGSVAMIPATAVDADGIVAALGMAGAAALRGVIESVQAPAVLVLDGTLDWLTPTLLRNPDLSGLLEWGELRILTRAKADRDCAIVAAASVLAKVRRDDFMVAQHERWPAYGWDRNKGYGSAAHREAIAATGPCELHRLTWLK